MVLPPLDLEWFVLQLKSPMVQFCTKPTLTTKVTIQLMIMSLFHSIEMLNKNKFIEYANKNTVKN